jgi:hypothetical protein
MSSEDTGDRREGSAASQEEMAPRWLSGGRSDVRLADNPTALAYAWFTQKLASMFLKEQRKRQKNESAESGPDSP